MQSRNEVVTAVVTLATASAVIGLWQWYRRRKVYVEIGKVEKLFFYPFKSLKAVEVDEISCCSHGVECFGVSDRSYMLISGKGDLVSQREEPTMVLLRPEVKGNMLLIHDDQDEPLKISLKKNFSPGDNVVTARIHSDSSKSIDCGDDAAEWFQRFLKRPDVRVVCYSPNLPNREYIKGNNPVFSKIKKENPVTFQDFSSFHILSKASMSDLSSRIETKISHLNFRPNVLLSGPPAYDEDNWKYLKFSSGGELSILLPTGRCLLTTNDPETGIKTDKEPLVTLRKFRMAKQPALSKNIGHSPGFGVNGWLVTAGKVCVGDAVFAVREEGRFKF